MGKRSHQCMIQDEDDLFSGWYRWEDDVLRMRMPSNIALIKYMGKRDFDRNLPANPSCSLTLPHLWTEVRLALSRDTTDSWSTSSPQLQLSFYGKERFLNFWQKLKNRLGIEGFFHIQSENNFPSDAGIASSSSSFAALTAAAVIWTRERIGRKWNWFEAAHLSQEGSGASGRSFFQGGCVWDAVGLRPWVPHWLEGAWHQVLIVEEGKKRVSSSEAHKRVFTSFLWRGRELRATQRLFQLLQPDTPWQICYEICWAEFCDMHALFETSLPHFGYRGWKTYRILSLFEEYWRERGYGPLVTMDAGPNIHLIWPKGYRMEDPLRNRLTKELEVLRVLEGPLGASLKVTENDHYHIDSLS